MKIYVDLIEPVFFHKYLRVFETQETSNTLANKSSIH